MHSAKKAPGKEAFFHAGGAVLQENTYMTAATPAET